MGDYDDDDMLFDSEADDELGEQEDDDPEVKAENLYFEAKDIASEDPREGLEYFQAVLNVNTDKGKWAFKSLKCMIKIHFTLGNLEKVDSLFQKLLTQYSSLLMENEKSLNSLLDFVQASPNITDMYSHALEQLEKNGNKKAMLRLQLRLAKVLFDKQAFDSLEEKLASMHKNCQLEDGTDDPSKGNQLMEIYALEISMYSARCNYAKLKELYECALKTRGLCNPRVAGVIHECGGKMRMRDHDWHAANKDFFEAFKNYDDAGVRAQSSQCLKYLVLANMLVGSDINPFHEQRARSYQSNPEIEAMISLVEAYQAHDISRFETCLAEKHHFIMDDPFMANYVTELIKKLRKGALLVLIKPYANITLSSISKSLHMTINEVESLLVELILDGKINGKIDQITQILRLYRPTLNTDIHKFHALNRLAHELFSLNKALLTKSL